ncbi:nodulation protein NfeD [bacterium]|nr:nodulation protein NfeD [bacterium]MBU1651272.1 nodulation protein NfeD [bacterium]MBU1881434.1 nodulation protein NfeD [bacterium]
MSLSYLKNLLLIVLLAGLSVSAKAVTVKTIEVDGVIHPASANFIQRAIEEANAANAEALLIELDTPGGLMDSMRDIIKAMLASDVPVIVYVSPSGSRAGSAGVFITMAAHIAAMAPGTNIGAAHPVSMGMGGGEQDSTGVMEEKVLNDAVAYIRSIAEKRGRNADWAESSVRESASITEREALELNVIDLIASSTDSLLIMLDGREVSLPRGSRPLNLTNVELDHIHMTWRDRMLDIISNPNVAYILMLLGMYGLFFELYNPGSIAPGVIGGICLILAFFAFQTLPVNIAGLLLILLAIILFILEIKIASYGILSIGGTISLLIGSIMLIDSPIPGLEISWSVIIPGVLATLLFFGVAITLAVRAQQRKPTTGREGMLGERGEAVDDLDPLGDVKIHGEFWRAKAAGEPVPAGSAIIVINVERLILIVEKDS